MSKFNQQGPTNSQGLTNNVTPISEAGKSFPARINRANPKNRGTVTEHSLRSTDVEVYGMAALKLLHENRFAAAFRLFETGRRHLAVNCLATPSDLEADFVVLEEKLIAISNLDEQILAAELNLVMHCLLHPLQNYQCFAAFSTLADLYIRENQQVLSDQLAQAFLEAMADREN